MSSSLALRMCLLINSFSFFTDMLPVGCGRVSLRECRPGSAVPGCPLTSSTASLCATGPPVPQLDGIYWVGQVGPVLFGGDAVRELLVLPNPEAILLYYLQQLVVKTGKTVLEIP